MRNVSPNVFAGYSDDPQATGQAVVDGWFRTGDVGIKDADGFRHIVDRKKDMIIRRLVRIVAELPLGPSHNVLKRELRERYRQLR